MAAEAAEQKAADVDASAVLAQCGVKWGEVMLADMPVAVREMTVSGLIEWQESQGSVDNDLRFCRLIKNAVPIFSDTPVEQLIADLSPAIIMELGAKVLELTGVTQRADEKN